MRPQFFEQEFHCIICTQLIPPEKLQFKSITCSDECARLRKLALRTKQDIRECRFCRKPSSLAERAAYQRYRKWETANPQLAYPAQYKRYCDQGDMDDDAYDAHLSKFTLAIAQQMAQEDEDAIVRAKIERAEAARAAAAAPPAEMESICEAGPRL